MACSSCAMNSALIVQITTPGSVINGDIMANPAYHGAELALCVGQGYTQSDPEQHKLRENQLNVVRTTGNHSDWIIRVSALSHGIMANGRLCQSRGHR